MEHFKILAKIIEEHTQKRNELRRIYRALKRHETYNNPNSWFGHIQRMADDFSISHNDPEHSDPKYIRTKSIKFNVEIRRNSTLMHINRDKTDKLYADTLLVPRMLSEYRKWCKLASKYRRVKRECKQMLDAMRVVGELHGTKIQTRSNNGMSFNRPFFITIGGKKITIKKFLEDVVFEEVIFGCENDNS